MLADAPTDSVITKLDIDDPIALDDLVGGLYGSCNSCAIVEFLTGSSPWDGAAHCAAVCMLAGMAASAVQLVPSLGLFLTRRKPFSSMDRDINTFGRTSQ